MRKESAALFGSESFIEALGTVFGQMATLFAVALLGFLAVRRNYVEDSAITALTRLLVDLIVPARLSVALMRGLDQERLAECGVVLLCVLGWTLGSMFVSWIATKLWRTKEPDPRADRAIWALCGLSNAVYLPLPLVIAMVPEGFETIGTIYIGGAFLAVASMQWTLGVFLLQSEERREHNAASLRRSLLGAVNPPVASVFIGSALAFVPVFANAARGNEAPFAARFLVDAADILGEALVPLSLIVLGMMIGRCHLRKRLLPRVFLLPVLIRLILAPCLMWFALTQGFLAWVPTAMMIVLIIESGTPPATNLSLIARRYGGDWELISAALLVTYLGAMVTMPFWVALTLTGFEP